MRYDKTCPSLRLGRAFSVEGDSSHKNKGDRTVDTLRILRATPLWQGIGAVVALIALFVATLPLLLPGRQVGPLQVVVLANTSLGSVEEGAVGDITVLYRDQPVDNLSAITVKLENIGNKPIREEDYARPITFMFSETARVVEAKPIGSAPPGIGIDIRRAGNRAVLSEVLLDEGNRIIVEFLVINIPADIGAQPFIVDAEIAGVRDIAIVSATEE